MGDYELYHHGVKGQKWGVRRTAAELGRRAGTSIKKTLSKNVSDTKAGKAISRGAKNFRKAASEKAQKAAKDYKEKAYYRNLKNKKISDMTDKELTDLTNRVKKESALKDAKYEGRVQNARKFYNTVAKQPVNTLCATYTKEAVKKAFGDDKKED